MPETPRQPHLKARRQTKAPRRAPPERDEPVPPPPAATAARTTALRADPRRCPCCETALADIVETATPSDLRRRGIEAIGTVECHVCGQGWVYADMCADADPGAVRAELTRFADFLCGVEAQDVR